MQAARGLSKMGSKRGGDGICLTVGRCVRVSQALSRRARRVAAKMPTDGRPEPSHSLGFGNLDALAEMGPQEDEPESAVPVEAFGSVLTC